MLALSRPEGRLTNNEISQVVVGMQHSSTTFCGMVITPKKAADARHFCFTQWIARSRLWPG
jgi:hypothetical protein